MSEWKEVRLGDVCEYHTAKVDYKELTLENYISTENMIPNKLGKTTATSIPSTKVNSYQKGHILVSNIRPYFKKIWKASFDGGCSADVLVFKAKNICDKNFLYALLSDDNFFAYSVQTSKGTKMPRGDKKALLEYRLLLPSLETQKKIATVLSALDEKIELNNKINKDLEDMAQAIFKSWFVDFEPFGGVMPDEWREGVLGDIARIENKTFNPLKNPTLFLEHYSIPAFDETKYPVFQFAYEIKSSKFIIDNECYMTSKLNPTTKRVWRPICLSKNAVCSTEFIVYKAKDSFYKEYLFSIINSDSFSDFMCSHVTGSTGSRQRTTPSTTLNYGVFFPDIFSIQRFSELSKSLYEKINTNITENQRLSQLRNTLLPRLMSGEIDVENVVVS